ncbi:hypothetical protein C7N43_02510 [Sphingobacteriales bacterium UPWRP_1]|nr:hypothetical protein B6N25_06010 [Sphingobacteriales bacterium TSM_CSS]PSJ78626.1 hypothetical protein C7N43_02510 [Sphingobacteriales bacterium UPWRP_1]
MARGRFVFTALGILWKTCLAQTGMVLLRVMQANGSVVIKQSLLMMGAGAFVKKIVSKRLQLRPSVYQLPKTT